MQASALQQNPKNLFKSPFDRAEPLSAEQKEVEKIRR